MPLLWRAWGYHFRRAVYSVSSLYVAFQEDTVGSLVREGALEAQAGWFAVFATL